MSLLTGKSYLGECHCSEDLLISRLLQDSLWRTATLPDFLIKADNLFIFGQAGSHLMAERLSTRLSAKVYRVQSFPAANNARTHVAHFLRKQLKGLGWSIGGKPLTLSPHASEKLAARELLRELGIHARPVFIHPGSGGGAKSGRLRTGMDCSTGSNENCLFKRFCPSDLPMTIWTSFPGPCERLESPS